MNIYEEMARKEQKKRIKEYEKNACRITPDDDYLGESVKTYYKIHGYV